jgi:tRNA (mo5U34)-methyltransferase
LNADDFYWYHSIDLGSGVVSNGDYQMSEYLHHYGFPEDMRGMHVLDVGRASGYFAFEFERRGAEVTATELPSMADWDFVGGEAAKAAHIEEIAQDEYHIRGAFKYAHEIRKSRVKPVDANVYDLSPSMFGRKFDLVFAGSITSHLKNPSGAMDHLLSVTAPGGTCIVSAPFIDIVEQRSLPLMALVGRSDPDLRSWWVVNSKGLEELLRCAGFREASVISHFNLKHRKQPELVFPHIVAHAKP